MEAAGLAPSAACPQPARFGDDRAQSPAAASEGAAWSSGVAGGTWRLGWLESSLPVRPTPAAAAAAAAAPPPRPVPWPLLPFAAADIAAAWRGP